MPESINDSGIFVRDFFGKFFDRLPRLALGPVPE
jgi:hypothetical protein